MSENATTGVPKPLVRKASVVFIDTQLPRAHPEFDHPEIRYDPSTNSYIPMGTNKRTATRNDRSRIPSRGPLPETKSMKFWSHIFLESMGKLKTDFAEPKGRCTSGYSIRADNDWESVRKRLIEARDIYSNSKGTEPGKDKKNVFQRFLKKSYRKMADNSEQLRLIAKIGEKIEYVSPVLAVVNILLDVSVQPRVKTAHT